MEKRAQKHTQEKQQQQRSTIKYVVLVKTLISFWWIYCMSNVRVCVSVLTAIIRFLPIRFFVIVYISMYACMYVCVIRFKFSLFNFILFYAISYRLIENANETEHLPFHAEHGIGCIVLLRLLLVLVLVDCYWFSVMFNFFSRFVLFCLVFFLRSFQILSQILRTHARARTQSQRNAHKKISVFHDNALGVIVLIRYSPYSFRIVAHTF